MNALSNISLQSPGISAGDTPRRIDTPNGYFAGGKMHYYVKDYQGNVRQVTDADGKVEQDNHYYPYGMLMAESSDILAGAGSSTANPYLFGSKEYLPTAGANLLDFTARTYDPSTLLFQTPDPLRDKYQSFNAYLYCLGNPILFTDLYGLEPGFFKWWNDHSMTNRMYGFFNMVGGAVEMAAGTAISGTIVGSVIGGIAVVHGFDVASSGYSQMMSGEETSTFTSELIQTVGASQETAVAIDNGIGMVACGVNNAGRIAKAANMGRTVASAKETIPAIKQIESNITSVAKKASENINLPKSSVRGTKIHSAVKNVVDGTSVEGYSIKSEVSYLNGEIVSYGTKGSVRLDVAVYDKSGTLVHVFDVKTGSATLKNSQIQKNHQHTRTQVPVTEFKIE